MVRKLTLLAAVLVLALAITGSAKDMTGMKGLGYYYSDAPVGLRYWFNEKTGLDVGIGFQSEDLGDETATNIWIEAGVPYVLVANQRANFFIRPGVVIGLLDNMGTYAPFVSQEGTPPAPSDGSWTTIMGTLSLGAEVFFGEHFSLEASHGIGLMMASPPGDEDSTTEFGTFGNSISHLGFHFYF